MLKSLAKRHMWAIFCAASATYFASRPSGLGQLLVMVSSLAALAAILLFLWEGIFLWKHKDPARLLSPLLIFAGFGAGLFLGHIFRDWNFNRNLPRYNHAVVLVSKQAIDDPTVAAELPDKLADLGYAVHVHNKPDCGLMVDFFWGSGFPVKHIVRRYAENPGFTEIPECRKDWASGRQLAPHWFEIRD